MMSKKLPAVTRLIFFIFPVTGGHIHHQVIYCLIKEFQKVAVFRIISAFEPYPEPIRAGGLRNLRSIGFTGFKHALICFIQHLFYRQTGNGIPPDFNLTIIKNMLLLSAYFINRLRPDTIAN
ncbi:hypothetical protein FQZ97_1051760 [compost metagenome]